MLKCGVCGSDNATTSVACDVCFAPLAAITLACGHEVENNGAEVVAHMCEAPAPCGFPLHLETERGTIPDVFKQSDLPGIEPAPLVPESVRLPVQPSGLIGVLSQRANTIEGVEPDPQLPLLDETPTGWYDGHVLPHYIGWYDVQMVSRLHEVAQPAPGLTRFWFAGRDWFTGPRAMEIGAPCVPIGKIYAWRGRAKP